MREKGKSGVGELRRVSPLGNFGARLFPFCCPYVGDLVSLLNKKCELVYKSRFWSGELVFSVRAIENSRPESS